MSFLKIDGVGNIEGQGSHLVSPEEEMAAQFASFGAYPYQSQQQMNPGGYGYNEPSSFYYNPMYQQPTVYKPYNMAQAGWNGGLGTPYAGSPNPAYAFMAQQGQGFYPQQQQIMKQPDVTYDIKPYNPFGTSEFLPPADWDHTLNKLRIEYFIDVESADIEREFKSNWTYNYNIDNANAYNYYNHPYYSVWSRNTSSIDSKYLTILNKMEEDARQARIDLNKNLVKLAYNFLRKDYDIDKIDEMFSPKTITIPGSTIIEDNLQAKLSNLVPFDNSGWYRAMDAKITATVRKYIPKDADLATTFENMGLVWLEWEMEEYKHKVNLTSKRSMYGGITYATLIKDKLREDYIRKNNIIVKDKDPASIDAAIIRDINSDNSGDQIDSFSKELKKQLLTCGEFPTLQQAAEMGPDGTLTISYATYKKNQESGNNINEDLFDQYRERFNAFLDSIPKAINTNMTNDERAKEYKKQRKIADNSYRMQNGIPIEDDEDVGYTSYLLKG